MAGSNRNYKDSLFTDYFKDKARLIEAYNAISGADYPCDAEIEFNTLENVLVGTQFNDISFTIGGRFIVFVEHQSTVNENMPLRLLMYCSRVYERIIDRRTLYRKTLHTIPVPQFYVIYNGMEKCPDIETLRLSDAYAVKDCCPALELTVPVYNISEGHNAEILKRSKALADYAAFVNLVNRYISEGVPREDAIGKAVQYCIRYDIMESYLESSGSEVINMLITEFNVEEYYATGREEGRAAGLAEGKAAGLAEGKEEGKAEGIQDIARKMKAAGKDISEISELTALPADEIEKL